jgi:hypothetical protein
MTNAMSLYFLGLEPRHVMDSLGDPLASSSSPLRAPGTIGLPGQPLAAGGYKKPYAEAPIVSQICLVVGVFHGALGGPWWLTIDSVFNFRANNKACGPDSARMLQVIAISQGGRLCKYAAQ